MLGPAVCCASTGPRPGASEPGLEPKPPGRGSDGGTGVGTRGGTRSPVLDRRKAGFDRAGGGDSSSLDVLGNLLGKLGEPGEPARGNLGGRHAAPAFKTMYKNPISKA